MTRAWRFTRNWILVQSILFHGLLSHTRLSIVWCMFVCNIQPQCSLGDNFSKRASTKIIVHIIIDNYHSSWTEAISYGAFKCSRKLRQ